MQAMEPTNAELIAECDEALEATWSDTGKEEVNKFLWQFLPGSMTLSGAEEVAVKIYEIMDNCWNLARTKKAKP